MRGCVETLISGGGLQKRYEERYGQKRSLEEIERDYREGDSNAAEFMGIFFQNFGRSMANLITVLDPDVVVLGGGVSNIEALYTEGVKEVARCIFSDSLETPIVKPIGSWKSTNPNKHSSDVDFDLLILIFSHQLWRESSIFREQSAIRVKNRKNDHLRPHQGMDPLYEEVHFSNLLPRHSSQPGANPHPSLPRADHQRKERR